MRLVSLTPLVTLALLSACGPESRNLPSSLELRVNAQTTSRFTSWSEPVNLGPTVNSPATDNAARLSPNGLSLYFNSNRPGGMGGNDIWVSRRASRQSPWETPVNVSMLNTASDDGGASLSPDGLMLFFNSGRPGGQGAADLYVSRRSDPNDDLGWGPPVNLGPLVNTAGGDRGPQFVLNGEGGMPTLYFNRGVLGAQGADIYAAPMTADGQLLGPAVLVANINVPDANDAGQFVSPDGREMWFWSGRAGGFGDADLWMSSRRNVKDAWSTPVNLGAPPNTEYAEERPYVTHDGRVLIFDSFRPGGINGSQDIWMAIRLDDDEGEENDAEVQDENGGPRFSDWSAPVNLGPVVNSAVGDIEVSVSKDGLSLYIASNRLGGAGSQNFDIFVSQRASVDDSWGPPQNLGPSINTPGREQAPFLSLDGHRLYFFSDRTGGFGGLDLYVSRRRDKHDDFGWQPPENLGSGVNGSFNETLPVYFEDEATGTMILYFASNRPGLGGTDIYASTLQPDETFGPAALVSDLSSAGRDAPFTIRRDGLEMFVTSDRPGTLGAFDIWVTTRTSTADPWSTPVNLGPVLNSASDDSRGSLSFDGTTLYMESDRPGGFGGHDLYVTTRAKLRGPD